MQSVKNRGWVKNAAIVFLAALLVLTFFSNTIMNRSLAEVATQGVTSGPITVRVRGTGTVTAVNAYELKAEQTRKIQSVLIRKGQEVSAGDVLFVLGEGASEELEEAAETLRQLELNYKRSASNMPVYNYELEEREIVEAKKTMEEAALARDAAKADLDRQVSASGEDGNALKRYQDELYAAQAALEDAKAAAGERLVIAWEKARLYVAVLEDALDALRASAPETGGSTGTGGSTETGGSAETGGAGQGETSAENGQNGNGASTPEEPASSGRFFGGHLAPRKLLAVSRVGLSERELAELDAIEAELAASLAGKSAAEQISWIETELVLARAELEQAENDLNADVGGDPEVVAASLAVNAAQAKLDSCLKKYGVYADAYDAAEQDYQSAKNRYETLTIQLEQTKAANSRSAASSSLDLQEQREQIERARQRVKELSGGELNQIIAPVGGIIESIVYTAGSTAPRGEVLCSIQVPDMGYTLSFSVTNEQARRLRTGDTATVSNYYWGREILATLTTIQNDPQAPQTNKLLTFDVTGDVNPGAELTISVGSRSQNYDTVVPNSAIRSDSNGSFVLRLEAKNSALGNRYFARRVDVTVLAQDDVSAAVSGDLGYGDFVITTSDRPVSVGDQVRMTDKG